MGAARDQQTPPTTGEIRAALTELRSVMAPALYAQLDAKLSAREAQWPQPKPPPYEADDEDESLEAPA